jgi:hypothetical protein
MAAAGSVPGQCLCCSGHVHWRLQLSWQTGRFLLLLTSDRRLLQKLAAGVDFFLFELCFVNINHGTPVGIDAQP